jgi:hypothetical protein
MISRICECMGTEDISTTLSPDEDALVDVFGWRAELMVMLRGPVMTGHA